MTLSVDQKAALAKMIGYLAERGFKSTGPSEHGFFEVFANPVDYPALDILVSANVSASHHAHWIVRENGATTIGSFRYQDLVNCLIRRSQ
jgi:hypothetical protein